MPGIIRKLLLREAQSKQKELGLPADIESETGGLTVGKNVRISLAAEVTMKKREWVNCRSEARSAGISELSTKEML